MKGVAFHIILKKAINKTVLHSVDQIFQYESFQGNNVRSHYYSVMFGTHNENNFLKAQTKENLEEESIRPTLPLQHHDVFVYFYVPIKHLNYLYLVYGILTTKE